MSRLRPYGGRRDVVHLAVELETLGAVGSLDCVDNIVEVFVGLLQRVAEGSVFVGSDAAADTKVKTPAPQ